MGDITKIIPTLLPTSPTAASTTDPAASTKEDTTTALTDTTTSTTTSSSSTTTSETTSATTTSDTTTSSSTTTSETSATTTSQSTTSTTSQSSSTTTTTSSSSSTTTSSSASSSSQSRVSSTLITQSIYTSDGLTRTATITTVVAGPSATDAAAVNTPTVTGSPKPFFQNTAAVAGTFSAVGIVALILLFWAGTAFLRRRRAQRVDEEADAAALEAYKTAADQRPYMDDEDEHDGFSGAGGRAYTDYSQETGHSMGQAPMVPSSGESYGMRELPQNRTYGDDVAYGAAGLGAGLGTNAALQRARSQKSGGSVSPYNAYAGNQGWEYGGQQDPYAAAYPIPNPQPYGQGQGQQQGYNNQAAPGQATPYSQYSGGSPGEAYDDTQHNPNRMSSAAIAAQQRGLSLARSPSQAVHVQSVDGGLHRNRSMTLEQGFANMPNIPAASSAQVQYAPGPGQQASPYSDIYGGYEDTSNRRTSLLDPASHSPPSPASPADANRRSHYEDQPGGLQYLDHDDEQPRMLRVANE